MKKRLISASVIISLLICLLPNTVFAKTTDNNILNVNVNLCMKIVFSEFGKMFENKTGIKIINNFVSDGHLIAQFQVAPTGDVVNVGAKFFMDKIEQHVEYIKPVTIRTPVILVPKGNPANIHTLADFAKEGVELSICDMKTSAMGRSTREMLEKLDLLEKITPNVVNSPKSSIILVPYIRLRLADAGVCWRSVTLQWMMKNNAKEDIEIIPIPKEDQVNKTSMIGVMKMSQKKELAKKYIDWVTSPERAEMYKKYGYTTFLGSQ